MQKGENYAKEIGQFVTLWKRNSQNKTEPFDIRDSFDFYVITTQQKDRFGLFLFPKHVLVENHILTNNGKGDGLHLKRVTWELINCSMGI
ncbi:MAG TPA: MepB family protein [Candidatus Sphingobacterium stercorigallinarum]|nr:MepB family protein [Candidatus Sphingobacterium stercorigallinarum]